MRLTTFGIAIAWFVALVFYTASVTLHYPAASAVSGCVLGAATAVLVIMARGRWR